MCHPRNVKHTHTHAHACIVKLGMEAEEKRIEDDNAATVTRVSLLILMHIASRVVSVCPL